MPEKEAKRIYRKKHFYKVTCARSKELLASSPWLKYQERDFCMVGYCQPTPQEAVSFIGNPIYDRLYDMATAVEEISKEEALRDFNMDNWKNQRVFGADKLTEQETTMIATDQETLLSKQIVAKEDIYQFSTGNRIKEREHYIGIIEKIDEDNVYIFNEKNPKEYQHYTLRLSDFHKFVNEGLYRIVTPRKKNRNSLDAQIQSAAARTTEPSSAALLTTKIIEPEI